MSDENYDYLFKIILTGDTGVGKSNILSRFMSNKFKVDTATTIGVEFTTKTVALMHDGRQVRAKLQLWDTAGQERYRSITAAYYRGAAGALLIYDITRPSSFEKCEDWLKELRAHAGQEIQIVLVGNKADLRHLREVQAEDGQNLAQKTAITFIETSAQTGSNVEEAFEQLVKSVIEQKQKTQGMTGSEFKPEVVDVEDGRDTARKDGKSQKGKAKGGCC